MKLVISGNYGAHNNGDELILEGILTAIRRIKPAAEITVLSEKPHETKNKYEINCLKKFPAGLRSFFTRLLNGDFKKTSKAVKECDFFMLGGGGLFDGKSLKGMIIWAVQAAFAYHYKKPVILYAQSISSTDSKLKKWIIKKVFKKASFIAVRDENSKEILKNIVPGKQIYTMPDMIFRIENQKMQNGTHDKVLICPKKIEWMKEELKKALMGFVNNLLQLNKKVEFLAFAKEDQKYLEDIADKVEIHQFIEDKNKIFEIFKEADFALCMRLHSALAAIVNGTPFVAVNYNPKVKNSLKSMGLEKYLIEPEDVDSEKLMEIFKKTEAEKNGIKKELEEVALAQLKKHLEVESHLKALID
jgi:polysaccharide pyruvyl transferase CsaB